MTAHPPSPNDDALDAAARRAHAASLEHLSPRIQAQLAQRRRAVVAGHTRSRPPLRGLHWLAGGVAAVGALALGLQLMRAPDAPQAPATTVAVAAPEAAPSAVDAVVAVAEPAAPDMPAPAPAPVVPDPIVLAEAAAAPDAATIDADTVLAAAVDASAGAVDAVASEFLLEEDPDFYLWLASVDASALPTEIP